jgi:catechol 2,3-dioxygenase-like lactoylglutathione lyase family enzyme
MLQRVDRILIRVPGLESAVRYYRDVLGMKLIRQDTHLASFKLAEGSTELLLHDDPDLPAEATYWLVNDVRELYRRRAELRLSFPSPPSQITHGYRAIAKDPFGTVLLLLDRKTEAGEGDAVENAKPAGGLFAGVEQRVTVNKPALIAAYEKIGRTADDLPYTPHFESLYSSYISALQEPAATRAEVWRHLLTLRKAGKLPKLGEAKSRPPDVSAEARTLLRAMLGKDIGKRDRLPYSKRFDEIVDGFNATQPRAISPHLVWRLVATLAK